MKRARAKTPTPLKRHFKDTDNKWFNKEIQFGFDVFIIGWIVFWSVFILIMTAL